MERNSILQFSKPQLSSPDSGTAIAIAIISQAVLTLLGNTQEGPPNLWLYVRSAYASVCAQSFLIQKINDTVPLLSLLGLHTCLVLMSILW